jgi:acylphosphatase
VTQTAIRVRSDARCVTSCDETRTAASGHVEDARFDAPARNRPIVPRVSDIVRAHVFVSGRVQGVFFRASCADQAKSLGVGGWVRNVPDGRVEAAFEGPRERVDEAVRWCRHGPPYAAVDHVEVDFEAPAGETTFRVR